MHTDYDGGTRMIGCVTLAMLAIFGFLLVGGIVYLLVRGG